jgi:hypothetical protein
VQISGSTVIRVNLAIAFKSIRAPDPTTATPTEADPETAGASHAVPGQMTADRNSLAAWLALISAGVLVALALARLPRPADWLPAPQTPFDRSEAWFARESYLLLLEAATVVPPGAPVTIRREPADPAADTSLFQHAVALLPGRRVLPAAILNMPTPELELQAEYLVLVGPRPGTPPGRLLSETAEGTIWRRSR